MNPESLSQLLRDLDHLLGVRGNFWSKSPSSSSSLETPEQLEQLSRDILVTLFGLEVEGL